MKLIQNVFVDSHQFSSDSPSLGKTVYTFSFTPPVPIFLVPILLNMRSKTPAGLDYTGADCQGCMNEAGFRETRFEHLVGPDSMVIGIR